MIQLLGGLLIAAGVLIATVSGLCGAIILYADNGRHTDVLGPLLVALLVGAGLIWAGVATIRAGNARDRRRYDDYRVPDDDEQR